MDVVAGDVAVGAIGDDAGLLAEAVPDGLALLSLAGSAFDLEGAGGDAPEEGVGEARRAPKWRWSFHIWSLLRDERRSPQAGPSGAVGGSMPRTGLSPRGSARLARVQRGGWTRASLLNGASGQASDELARGEDEQDEQRQRGKG